MPYKHPNINYNLQHQWINEYHQHNYIRHGIDTLITEQVLVADEDIILTSDVDGIPNPNILINAKNNTLVFDRNILNRMAPVHILHRPKRKMRQKYNYYLYIFFMKFETMF